MSPANDTGQKPAADSLTISVCGAANATQERAQEIASLKDFGLREFIELTGVGVGDYGIYRITPHGVMVHSCEKATLKDLLPGEQIQAMDAEEQLSLKFPCSPLQFQEWYDATRGTNGVSDFNLASGFLDTLAGTDDHLADAVVASKIVAAFDVESNPAANKKWWNVRMRGTKRYGLTGARALLGRAQVQSMWHPLLVAHWLIEKKHLNHGVVLMAMKKHFPDVDITYLT